MRDLVEEGKKFKQAIERKGITPNKLGYKTEYSISRIFRFIKGENDLATLNCYNAKKFATILGFETIDDFYTSMGIDLMKKDN